MERGKGNGERELMFESETNQSAHRGMSPPSGHPGKCYGRKRKIS